MEATVRLLDESEKSFSGSRAKLVDNYLIIQRREEENEKSLVSGR